MGCLGEKDISEEGRDITHADGGGEVYWPFFPTSSPPYEKTLSRDHERRRLLSVAANAIIVPEYNHCHCRTLHVFQSVLLLVVELRLQR